jgi:hypothetical protein
MSRARRYRRAGCSKRLSGKAAGESKPEAYPLGYVEDFDEPRTPLAVFFSILLYDSMLQQVMQMHDPDNSLRIVLNDERADGIPLHHFDRLGCQLIRSDQLRMS